jgi:hypothetical protein
VVCGCFLLVAVGYALDEKLPLAGRLSGGAFAVAFVAFLLRARHAGIEARHQELVVRPYFGRVSVVPWGEVSSFEIVPCNNSFTVMVVLRDGGRLISPALRTGPPGSADAQACVEQLEATRPSETSAEIPERDSHGQAQRVPKARRQKYDFATRRPLGMYIAHVGIIGAMLVFTGAFAGFIAASIIFPRSERGSWGNFDPGFWGTWIFVAVGAVGGFVWIYRLLATADRR